MIFRSDIDLQKNQILNPRLHNLTAAPSAPVKGQLYFNTTTNRAYGFNGTHWVDMLAAKNGTLDAVTLINTPVVRTNSTKAAGNNINDAFRVESSDSEPLFQVKTNGDTVIAGVLTVNGTGDSTFAGNVVIGGNLTVDGTITGGTKVDLAEDLEVQGNLRVKGNTYLGDDAAQDATYIKGYTKITSKASLSTGSADAAAFVVESKDARPLFQVMENGDAKIAGILTVSAISSSGDAGSGTPGATLEGDTVVDNLTVRRNLNVWGNTVLGDNAASDTTTIKGVTNIISKTTKEIGSASVAAFAVKDSVGSDLFQVMENGDTIIAGVLKVLGTGESEFAGNVKIGGNLTVMGDATVKGVMRGDDFDIEGNLNVKGNTMLGDNPVYDTTRINGFTQIKTPGSKLDANAGAASVFKIIDNAATPNTLFDVRQNGDAILAGTLTVSGMNGGITTSDDLTVHGNLTVKGNTLLGDAASDTIRIRGIATFEQHVNMSGKRITNVAEPVDGKDVATKSYVDASTQGLDVKPSARAATTGNVTLSGVQTIDGVTLAVGDRVLVKNQATASQNGIYIVQSGTWTRSDDTDGSKAGEVTSGMFTFVEEGVTNAGTGWILTTLNPITVGSTGLEFTQFSTAGIIEAGNGLTKNGNTLSVVGTSNRITVSSSGINIATNYVGQTSITTLGTISTGTWNATTISLAKGGTGATTAVGARANLGATGKYAKDIGTGTATSFVVTHNLGSDDVVVSVRDKATKEQVMVDIEHTSDNSITLNFASAPPLNAYRVVVVG